MTNEQQRIKALEDVIFGLLDTLEEARNGFGSHLGDRVREEMRQNRDLYPMRSGTAPTKTKAPQTTPPAAPEEEAVPA